MIHNRLLTLLVVLSISIISVVLLVQVPASASAMQWQEKVDPRVLQRARDNGETEFILFLREQADVSGAATLTTKEEKGAYVYAQLAEMARRTQPGLIAALEQRDIPYRPYWIANMIWARGDVGDVQALAQQVDVAHVYANPYVRLDAPVAGSGEAPFGPDSIEWNILKVRAPEVWALGITGQNVVIAGQDTGYDWDHPALINQYRGWNGSTADHNYNWHDAIHSGGGVCGPDSPQPCDDYGHGTHTMGTMVGDDGGSNQIGMAPGARWIGCRNMDEGVGSPTTYSECFQWFMAPTDLNGQNPDTSKAPHVVNNSWSCPPSEGCNDPAILQTVVENTRAAGIVVVVSAGNSGPGCETVSTPAAIYDASFTVGSTTSTDAVSDFSSRGPVIVDGSGRPKPDISAPGSFIRSSVPGTGYSLLSGTSMAGPHVAGLVGLLIAAEPGLAGQVDALEAIITQSALPLTSTQMCGGVPGSSIPNNTFGYGRIDALAAYEATRHVLTVAKSPSTASIMPGGLLIYTLVVSHSHLTLPTHNVVLSDVLPTNTTFVDATAPYTISGKTIWWETTTLGPDATWSVNLIVQADQTFTGALVNDDYGVLSDEVGYTSGAPVVTPVTGYRNYVPFANHEAGD